jgi:hypothetical protein
VFTLVSEPVAAGFVASLAHPGGNITGFTNLEPSMGSESCYPDHHGMETSAGGRPWQLRSQRSASKSLGVQLLVALRRWL